MLQPWLDRSPPQSPADLSRSAPQADQLPGSRHRQPIIAPLEKIEPRKIVGTLFASTVLPIPPKDQAREFVALCGLTVVHKLLKDAKLFKASGRSAEPIALDGQFIVAQLVTLTPTSLDRIDGRPVVVVHDNGAWYFRRFRRHGALVVLERLNPDGTAPSEILSLDGEHGRPRLTGILEVVGVLFELPD